MFQKSFAVDNIKKTGLNEKVYNFFVNFENIDFGENMYLMKKNNIV